MAKRSFDDSFWGDTFVQEIEKDAKYLFMYLWTNKYCNSAGIYEITLKTIAFDTGIPHNELPRLLDILQSKVYWSQEFNIVWVKNFLKHQPKSEQFLKSVADCLLALNNTEIENNFRDYYNNLGVLIPYRYPSNTVGRQYRYLLELELDKELDNNNKQITMDNNVSKIFETFEGNFQKITPIVAEQLKDFIQEYGSGNVLNAMSIAIKQNKRSMAYMGGVLENRDNGKPARNNKATEPSKKRKWGDPLR